MTMRFNLRKVAGSCRYAAATFVSGAIATKKVTLLATNGAPPAVTGVRYTTGDDEMEISADIVVDASGRHSKAPEWLAAIGAPPPRERQEIAAAAHFIEEMTERVRGKRAMGAEPAHIFPPPGG